MKTVNGGTNEAFGKGRLQMETFKVIDGTRLIDGAADQTYQRMLIARR